MLPMTSLQGGLSTAVMVELKSGECFNGYLSKVDYFMNIKLTEVIHTDPTGESFRRVDECFIRGNQIKYIKVTPEAIQKASQIKVAKKKFQARTRPRVFKKTY